MLRRMRSSSRRAGNRVCGVCSPGPLDARESGRLLRSRAPSTGECHRIHGENARATNTAFSAPHIDIHQKKGLMSVKSGRFRPSRWVAPLFTDTLWTGRERSPSRRFAMMMRALHLVVLAAPAAAFSPAAHAQRAAPPHHSIASSSPSSRTPSSLRAPLSRCSSCSSFSRSSVPPCLPQTCTYPGRRGGDTSEEAAPSPFGWLQADLRVPLPEWKSSADVPSYRL